MVGISPARQWRWITERHSAGPPWPSALIRGFGRGPTLVQGLTSMGAEIPESSHASCPTPTTRTSCTTCWASWKANYLIASTSTHRRAPTAAEVVEFADSVGAIATTPTCDVSASPTGDKKAEKPEDD